MLETMGKPNSKEQAWWRCAGGRHGDRPLVECMMTASITKSFMNTSFLWIFVKPVYGFASSYPPFELPLQENEEEFQVLNCSRGQI